MSRSSKGDACPSEELERNALDLRDALDPTLTVSDPHSSGRVCKSCKHDAASGRLYGTFVQDELIAFRYRIIRAIARGGMGEVYEADDLEMRQRIALKVVRRERALGEDGFGQLKREMYCMPSRTKHGRAATFSG